MTVRSYSGVYSLAPNVLFLSKGFSLLEMLLALLIIAVGLLGMAGLQAYSLKNNTSAYLRSQANALVYEIIDAMRANRRAALDGQYAVAMDEDPPGSGSRANRDLTIWLAKLAHAHNGLPAGDGEISCMGSSTNPATPLICTVTVQWNDTREVVSEKASAGATQQFSVSTRI